MNERQQILKELILKYNIKLEIYEELGDLLNLKNKKQNALYWLNQYKEELELCKKVVGK